MMIRTTIMLPEQLKAKAASLAQSKGISLGELIREGLGQQCANQDKITRDCFFADNRVYTGEAPTDLSEKHDDYLY